MSIATMARLAAATPSKEKPSTGGPGPVTWTGTATLIEPVEEGSTVTVELAEVPTTDPSEPDASRDVKNDATTGEISDLASAREILVAAIPGEVLAPYTALVGIIASTVDETEKGGQWLPLRWWVFAAGAVLVLVWFAMVYRSQRPSKARRRQAFYGAGAGLVAFGAWGLVMPGSPLGERLTGATLTITLACISIGGAVVVSFLAKMFSDAETVKYKSMAKK